MMRTAIMTITPELAAEYLQHNKGNRALRSSLVETYMRDMKAGNWKLTHQGIAFDKEGNLRDGQHRLTACVLSGVPFTTMVTWDLDADTMIVLDTGAKRTFRDYDKLSGGGDDPALRCAQTIAMVRALIKWGYNGKMSLTNQEIVKVMNGISDQIHAVYRAGISRGKKANAEVMGGALAAVLCGETEQTMAAFFNAFLYGRTDGCGGFNVSAAFGWSKTILEGRAMHRPVARSMLYKGTKEAIWKFAHGKPSKRNQPLQEDKYVVYDMLKKMLKE